MVFTDFLDHVSAGFVGWHSFEEFFFPIENSYTVGSQHFVSGKNQKIAVNLFYINWNMRNALRGIYHSNCFIFLGKSDHFFYRVDTAQNIGSLGDRYQSCFFAKQFFVRCKVQFANSSLPPL